MKKLISLVLVLLINLSCATAPYTGRSQVMLVSEGQEMALGDDAYRHILRDSVISRDPDAERIVRKVGERIAQAADKPEYRWEFSVINDPDTVNAFAVPGGKVAVYTGIFGPARDEAGLAVVLGHEVAHALARHPAERMSQALLLELGGVGLGLALGKNPALANQVLQAYGMVGGVGLLPFSRSQETEADRIGLILMAKAGYDPHAALELWERMEKKDGGRSAPPEFLSTHPSYETRVQQIRSFLPEALRYYRPSQARLELLPSAASLDTPAARSERALLKRIQTINQFTGEQTGERIFIEALARDLRMSPQFVFQERQQFQVGYGQYAALRGVSYLGRASARRALEDYRRGLSWSELASSSGIGISDLTAWIDDLIRAANNLGRQWRSQPPRRYYRPGL